MRLKLTLKSPDYRPIPINYNFALSAIIYKLLRLGSPEFAEFLHSTGFKLNGRPYKLFTFVLKFEDSEIVDNAINIFSPEITLYISSPLIDDFIKNILKGTFVSSRIELVAQNLKCSFDVIQAELIPPPVFHRKQYFKPFSPLVLSTFRDEHKYYFRPDEPIDEVNRVFNQNLMNKYELITGKIYEGQGLRLIWDNQYIEEKLKHKKRLTRKVSILQDLNNPIDVIGMYIPFILEGDSELMRVGYESGFGEKNSMGFGMYTV